MFEMFKIKTQLIPFGEFGFCSIGKEKDDSQQEGEREEETTNSIKVTSSKMELDQWDM